MTGQDPFGVYVHIPFCAHRCDYCDFATWTDRAHLMDAYAEACVAHLQRRRDEGPMPAATSVFFGGGTPSLLPAGHLTRILAAIELAPGAEVTVECNPDSVGAPLFDAYVAAGVNRLSFGVQSLRSHVLQLLNRTHDPANVDRAVALARAAGIHRVNLDLIYGTPGETLDDWRATLLGALELGPEHVSAYALTVEPGTPLGRRVDEGRTPAPDDDDQAVKYELADEILGAGGYEWYEVSNWARPGEECRHNLLYWSMGEYAPIGCAAHGHERGRRFWNVRTPDRYIEHVLAGRDPVAGEETLDAEGRAEESFTLALRTRTGAPVASPATAEVEALAAAGLLEVRSATRGAESACGEPVVQAVLTRTGRLMASDVTARLLLAGAATAA